MRRNDLDICVDILEVAKPGAKKTRIVYKANLNFKIVGKYLRRLIEGGFLENSKDDRFVTTSKGANFIKDYRSFTAPITDRIVANCIPSQMYY